MKKIMGTMFCGETYPYFCFGTRDGFPVTGYFGSYKLSGDHSSFWEIDYSQRKLQELTRVVVTSDDYSSKSESANFLGALIIVPVTI